MAAGGDGHEAPDPPPVVVKMVDMPAEYLRWVLAQDKEDYRVPTLEDYTAEEIAESGRETILGVIASLQAAYDDFAGGFRAWVRGALDMGGRVVVRQDMLFSDPREWQEVVDREWAGAQRELGMESTGPLGPHTCMLSTYLSFVFQVARPAKGC